MGKIILLMSVPYYLFGFNFVIDGGTLETYLALGTAIIVGVGTVIGFWVKLKNSLDKIGELEQEKVIIRHDLDLVEERLIKVESNIDLITKTTEIKIDHISKLVETIQLSITKIEEHIYKKGN